MWEETLIFGDPDRCAKRIRELQGMGVNSLLCWMVFGGLEHAKVLRSMELFAKHVMPQFQERPAAAAAFR
jgi:alkanesulfonate monooxygenase SsuD/methylene tetrahydromethanopterin reductase-like flavin-dependent oxidoreductase (luciferase family)